MDELQEQIKTLTASMTDQQATIAKLLTEAADTAADAEADKAQYPGLAIGTRRSARLAKQEEARIASQEAARIRDRQEDAETAEEEPAKVKPKTSK